MVMTVHIILHTTVKLITLLFSSFNSNPLALTRGFFMFYKKLTEEDLDVV